MATALEQ